MLFIHNDVVANVLNMKDAISCLEEAFHQLVKGTATHRPRCDLYAPSHENKEGRYPGTRGSKDVISYIIKEFKSYGLKPGLENTYVQPFDITTGIKLVENNWAILNGDTLIPNIDYTPLSFSSNANNLLPIFCLLSILNI